MKNILKSEQWSPQTNSEIDEASEAGYDGEDDLWSYVLTSRPSKISDRQDPIDVKSNDYSTKFTESEEDDIVQKMLKPRADIELLADEVQKACDIVSEVTAAKRELSLEIDALEKKLTKAYTSMEEVSNELAEAVAKMAKETQRLRSAMRTKI